MQYKKSLLIGTAIALLAIIVGGFSAYLYLKYQEISQDDFENVPTDWAEGDAGDNPPEHTIAWNEYLSPNHGFSFKYPDSYQAISDDYGWPHSDVHLINKAGGQSYDVTFEFWANEGQANNEGRTSETSPFFRMMENPSNGELISMTCWNPELVEDCEQIYSTLTFQ